MEKTISTTGKYFYVYEACSAHVPEALQKMQDTMDEEIKNGYEPYGFPVVINHAWLCQTMIKQQPGGFLPPNCVYVDEDGKIKP